MKYINLQVVKSVDSINLRLLENHFKYNFDTQTFKENIAKDYDIDWTKEQILQSDMYVEFNNKAWNEIKLTSIGNINVKFEEVFNSHLKQ